MYNPQPNTSDIQKATALYCEGMRLTDIAQSMSMDETDVFHLVGKGKELGYFVERPILNLPKLTPEVQDFVSNETLTCALSKTLKSQIELVHIPIVITPSPKSMFTTYEIEAEIGGEQYTQYRMAEGEALKITCKRAAQELARGICDGKDHSVGVNWGTIVKETVSHIRPLPSQLESVKLSIISLFGDLAFHMTNHGTPLTEYANLNSNAHATQLAQQLGKSGRARLLNVPGFIPASFAQDKKIFNELRTFLASHASYQSIFGGPPPDDPQNPRMVSGITNSPKAAEITKIDTIITGFGSADSHTLLHEYLRSWLNAAEIERLLEYQKGGKVVGDIGGHLVASYEAKHDDDLRNFLSQVNRRLIAAQPSDFVDVASRHLKSGEGGGVVGITVGARKAKILQTLLSWVPCPISRLIIDSHCALALLYLFDSVAFHRFVEQEGKRFTAGNTEWSSGTRQLIPV